MVAPTAVVRGEGREAGAGWDWLEWARVALVGGHAHPLCRQPADGKPVRRYLVARRDTWLAIGRQPSFAVSFLSFCRQPADGISSLRRQPTICRQLVPGMTAYVPLPSAPTES